MVRGSGPWHQHLQTQAPPRPFPLGGVFLLRARVPSTRPCRTPCADVQVHEQSEPSCIRKPRAVALQGFRTLWRQSAFGVVGKPWRPSAFGVVGAPAFRRSGNTFRRRSTTGTQPRGRDAPTTATCGPTMPHTARFAGSKSPPSPRMKVGQRGHGEHSAAGSDLEPDGQARGQPAAAPAATPTLTSRRKAGVIFSM